MKRNDTIALLLCALLVSGVASAQDPPAASGTEDTDNAIHDELRAIRETLTDALKKGDVDGQFAHVHKNVVAIRGSCLENQYPNTNTLEWIVSSKIAGRRRS